jgi:hypothetical protein
MILRLTRYLFLLEATINSISTLLFLLKPELMLQNLIADTSLITPLVLEMLRWYGGLLLVITIILWRVLFSKNPEPLRLVLEAYLLGDIVYLVSQIILANLAGYVFGTYLGIGFTILLFLGRAYYLLKTRDSLSPA